MDMDKIAVAKVKLQEGEELMDFVQKVMEAVSQQRQKTQRSMFVRGIFKGFVIMRDFESGNFFQSKLTRDKEGLVKLGDPFAVRQTFVPIAEKVAKSEGEEDTSAEEEVQYIEVKKAESFWAGVL